MILDFNQLAPSQRYFAMVQTIIPRPIAWVLTDNGDAREHQPRTLNLAPFSFFTGICSDPPLLMISVGKKTTGEQTGQAKDTRRNILERKHFVVHIASTAQLAAVNASSAPLAHGDSELAHSNLATQAFEDFPLPRLSDCTVAFACTLYRFDEIGNAPQAVIYGQIERLFIDDALLEAHESRLIVSAEKLDPLARLGGNDYSGLGLSSQFMRIERPK